MVSEKLKELYAQAFQQGLYVKEFPSKDGAVAFCSSNQKLTQAGFDSKDKRKKMDLMSANLYMAAAGADTREEAVEQAIAMFMNSEDWIPRG